MNISFLLSEPSDTPVVRRTLKDIRRSVATLLRNVLKTDIDLSRIVGVEVADAPAEFSAVSGRYTSQDSYLYFLTIAQRGIPYSKFTRFYQSPLPGDMLSGVFVSREPIADRVRIESFTHAELLANRIARSYALRTESLGLDTHNTPPAFIAYFNRSDKNVYVPE